ncbi:MAG: carboxypeptidase regulatory-like domain-containing protein [Planctomycetaceae bacterium]|nr:carboxypeptidase regulatory-like domain-containing protein [Planctomycetaceae bacterium]
MLTLGLLLAVFQQPRTPVAFGRFEGAVSGTVLDERGAPLEGARVEWRVRGEERSILLAGGRSGADGRFDFDVERSGEGASFRDAFLVIEVPGLAPTRVEQLLAPDEDFELGPVHVYPFAELHGRVTTLDGAPIAGAQIHAAQGRVVAPSADTWSLEPLATTDANGAFACRNVPSGVVTLGVSAEGFADLVLEPRSLALRSPNELSVTLEPGRSVTFTVLAGATNKPVVATCSPLGTTWPQAEVGHNVGPGSLAFWRRPQVGGVDGRLRVDGLRVPFTGGVLLEAEGCTPRIVSLAWAESEVSLSRSRWIEVSARRQGSTEGVELAALSVRDDSPKDPFCGNGEEINWIQMTANSSGVERLAPQRWRVEWRSPISARFRSEPTQVLAFLTDGSSEQAPVTIDPVTGAVHAEIEFGAPSRLVGRVVTPSGDGLQLDVEFRRSFLGPNFLFSTGADGRFDVSVGSGFTRFASARRRWTLSPETLDDLLKPGETREVVLTATRMSSGCRLRGNVTIGGSQPDRPLLLVLGEERDRDLVYTHSDATGRFEFDLAVPNTFRVTPLLPAPPDTSFREFRREIAPRTIGSIRSLPRTSDEFEDVLLELPPLAEWPRAPRSER